MRCMGRVLIAGVAMALCGAPALAGGNANFFLGNRALDKDFWTPVNGQVALGTMVDFGKMAWPVHLETGVLVSVGAEKDFFGNTDVVGSVAEICFGVNKTWSAKGSMRPFIGGGLSSVGAAYWFSSPGGDVDDNDSSGGVYFHGGVFWRLRSRFNIGIDGRLLAGTKITLFGADGNADYLQLGMVLGWGWPGGQ